MKNCLYCYEPIDKEIDFHEKCSLSFFGTREGPLLEYNYEQLDELAKQVVERSVTVPGVQAKLSLSLIKQTDENSNTSLTVGGVLGGNYIFKPPSPDYPEIPANEHLTMCIAEAYGINVVPSSLIRLKSGELSYITKRIDRTPKGEKIHMLDMFQITEAFDKYRSSMEKVGKAIGEYSQNTLLDKLYFFELALFSFLTGNNDMHLKNFSMIATPRGWMLSPAYDLLNVTILNPDDPEELALTLNGKKRKLNLSHFEKLGKELGLTERQVAGVYRRFKKHLPKALQWINGSFLSEEMKRSYITLLESRYKRLF